MKRDRIHRSAMSDRERALDHLRGLTDSLSTYADLAINSQQPNERAHWRYQTVDSMNDLVAAWPELQQAITQEIKA